MAKVLKLQLTFNELEFPAAMAPLLCMPPHFRSRFCKQVIELYFREGGDTSGVWPTRRTVMATTESEVISAKPGGTPEKGTQGPIDQEMFNDSFASYF
jgi:hypothetical protein